MPSIRVLPQRGKVIRSQGRFAGDFTLGRGDTCDVQFAEPFISSVHASVLWKGGQWWVQDMHSKNGTFLDGKRIDREPLPRHALLELALNGPAVILEMEQSVPGGVLDSPFGGQGLTQVAEHYFGSDAETHAGARTRLIRQAFQKVHLREKKRYWRVIGVIAALLILTAGALYYQSRRVARLEQLHQQEQNYDNFARDELGISQDKMSAEDWLIYKAARGFGECDVRMPPAFIQTVKDYIHRWQTTQRLQLAIARAEANGYGTVITRAMIENDLPPQFFFLALQESDFDYQRCGPWTRFGVAKGLWQFIPETAWKYGLRTGPLAETRRYDRLDERYDVRKATEAAARYLKDLYQTEAQGSGLLVMACYNWGESNVLDLVRRMPENPRDRNFWNMLLKEKIPDQTYDYVFYIFSATVIGEDPHLFGFDFPEPLKVDFNGLAPADSVAQSR